MEYLRSSEVTSKSSGRTLHITKTDTEESPHREYMLIIFYVITNTGDKKLN